MSGRFRKRGFGSKRDSEPDRRGRRGGKVAAGSVAATVVGAVIKDLSRPNSLIRGLVAAGRRRLLAWRTVKPDIDISNAVEVEVEDVPLQRADSAADETNSKEV
jgi:hypothetical protein